MASSPGALAGCSSSAADAAAAATCAAHGLTPDEFARLRAAATAAKARAYCPYSRFRVGAAVLGVDGSVTAGANVENASFPVGTCAERVALGRAVADGARAFRAVAVASDADARAGPPASPCGMCRQFIREFCAPDVPVIMFDNNAEHVVLTLQQLLPMSFGPDSLPPPGAPGAA